MPRIDLKQGEQKKHVARALKELRDGYVIVAPLEHGYVYLADAFSHYSVRAMHVLRKDADGIAVDVFNLGKSARRDGDDRACDLTACGAAASSSRRAPTSCSSPTSRPCWRRSRR